MSDANPDVRVLSSQSFAPKIDFVTNNTPFWVATGDLNKDGKVDVVTCDANDFASSGTLSILLNNSTGLTPSFADRQELTTLGGPLWIVAQDLNTDGKLDLAIANSRSGSASVFLNTTADDAATVTMSARFDFLTADGAVSIVSGDLNGDGKPDLAVGSLDAIKPQVSILLNTMGANASVPTFANAVNFVTGRARGIALADINGDGKLDVITSNGEDANVSVLMNMALVGSTTPAFAPAATFEVAGRATAPATGDLNHDGKPDIVVVNASTQNASVLINTTPTGAAPTFLPHRELPTGAGAGGVVLSDLNGDAVLDIVVTSQGQGISVIPNVAPVGSVTETFGSTIPFNAGVGPLGVAVADLNGDALPDIIVANTGSDTMSVLAGR